VPAIVEQAGDDCLIRVKAVPGARSDAIAGPLGDRLKVRVGAPPEGGRANEAIVALLAGVLGRRSREVTIASGRTRPEKTVRVAGARAEDVSAALGLG
jgi:uncharacterized protein (TIGR00251 family)